MNNYHLYLDYLELRRRVEKHLSRAYPLIAHVLIFAIIVHILGWYGYQGMRDLDNYYFIAPEVGQSVAVWSVLLLLQTIWHTLHSGLLGHKRTQAIETEMRARIELNDSYLTDDPKMLFRLHGILEDDVRIRSGVFGLFLLINTTNMLIWLPWALENARTSRGWITAEMLAVIVLPVLLLYGLWRNKQGSSLRKKLESVPSPNLYNTDDEEIDMHLSEDGELVDFQSQVGELKKKRS